MQLKDPEPKTRLVIDVDLGFLNGVRPLTLIPERGDSITTNPKTLLIVMKDERGNVETITVERHNLLWWSERPRQQKLPEPKKPPVPPDQPATP